jgi:hypothetical protein
MNARGSAVASVVSLLALAISPQAPANGVINVVAVTPPDALRPAEVSVAISPSNPDHVIAVLLQAGKPGEPRVSNHAYVSIDGGRTWTGAATPNADGRVQGDDSVAFGRDGTAYHGYISFDGIRASRPERAWSGIFVRSTRDGVAWSPPIAVVDHINTAIPFEDKSWLGVDRSADSPHRGNLYVAWTRFDVYGSSNPAHRSHIMVSRSRDGGRSFSTPLEISDETGDARDSDDTLEGVVPVVGPGGEAYVAWAGPKGILIDKSTDGGWSFGEDRFVTSLTGGWDLPVPGLERHNGMPVAAVDLSSGERRGTVYLNFIDERNGDPDVFVTSSNDGGVTWSAPARVNDDAKGAVQMFTWMAVDSIDGSINIVFHDRRGLSSTMTGVTIARSIDGGRTFVNHRVPQPAFDCCQRSTFFGDYNGIDASDGRVVAAFPVLTPAGDQRVLAAVMRFRPGTQELQ